jgi:hypothetical protein
MERKPTPSTHFGELPPWEIRLVAVIRGIRLGLSGALFFVAATGVIAAIFGVTPVERVIDLAAAFVGMGVTLLVINYDGKTDDH